MVQYQRSQESVGWNPAGWYLLVHYPCSQECDEELPGGSGKLPVGEEQQVQQQHQAVHMVQAIHLWSQLLAPPDRMLWGEAIASEPYGHIYIRIFH